jgi:NTP pyrophosphatase (non-canonical NTP hydrolase)
MNLEYVVNQCMIDSEAWFPNVHRQAHSAILHHTLGLAGEVGEFANLMKKVDRDSMSMDEALPLLRQELTDVFIYVANLIGYLEMDLEHEYKKKRIQNDQRFGRASREIE